MQKIKQNWIKTIFSSIFVVVLTGLGISLIANTSALETIKYVEPGAGTLKKAVEEAEPGTVLKLRAGSYTGGSEKIVTIDKELTIEGVGNGLNSPRNKTIIDVPITVATTSKVVLSNFESGIQSVEPNFIFIKADAKVNLDIKDVYIWGILRGDSNGKYQIHDAMVLDVTSNADGSLINITKSTFAKPGVHYGIYVNASDTTINISDSEILGRNAIKYEDGSNNKLYIKEKSLVTGPSVSYKDNEAIAIYKEDGLTIEVDDSTIGSEIPSGNGPTKIFSFGDGENKSTNVTIDIKNGSIIADKDLPNARSTGSVIFGFAPDNTASDNNIVKIDATSTMYLSLVDGGHYEVSKDVLPFERKYSKVSSASVVGIYDSYGNVTIKLYDENTKISELIESEYIERENYKFKGWFKAFDGETYSDEYNKVGDDYPLTVAGTNMDLYPKFVKIINMTIKDVPIGEGKEDKKYILEEGQTIAESEYFEQIKSDLASIKNKEGQVFKGFVIYNGNGSQSYSPLAEDELINSLKMTEDCSIEAIHQVSVTINGEEAFYLDAGKTLNDLKEDPRYDSAKMKNSNGRSFSRFVDRDGKEVKEEDGITANITLTAKYLNNVTIGDNTYPLEEGLTLNSSKEIKEVLESISGEVEGRHFSGFYTNEEIKINPETDPIEESLEIEAVYKINVKLVGKTDVKTYEIVAGSNLKSLNNDTEILSAMDDVALNIESGKTFDGFVASYDKDSSNIVFDRTREKDKEVLKNELLLQNLSYDTTIYARYNVVLTINDEEFELEAGETIEKAILNSSDNALKERYKNAKYNSKDENRFSRFVDSDGNEVKESDEIEKSMTLTPKYLVFVEIIDEREDVKGVYSLEEGLSINDLLGEDAKFALETLRSDIVATDEENRENLHFEKLVDEEGADIELDSITKDIKIKAVYHYDVSIVEDYDNPAYDDSAIHEGTKGLKVYRNETLRSNEQKVKEALGLLKNSATNEEKNRKFYSYVETNTNKEFTEDELDALLDTKFNTHLYINAKVSYKVKIVEDEYYVVEGKKVKESGNSELLDKIESLAKAPGKLVARFIVNGKEMTEEALYALEVNDYVEVEVKYGIEVKIGEETFTIEDGKTLASYEDQAAVDEALNKLKEDTINNGYNFKGYYYTDGDDKLDFDKDETVITKNTTIGARYNIEVSIEGEELKKFEIEANGSLADVKESNPDDYTSVTTKENRTFLHFVTEDGVILEDGNTSYKFNKNTKLTPVFAVVVKINEEDYYLEEGKKLSSDTKIMEALEKLESKDKRLVAFTTDKSDTQITIESIKDKTDDDINDNITLTPKYVIDVEIVGLDTYKETVDENTLVGDLKYEKPVNFIRFEDYDTAGVIDDDFVLTKHTKLRVIYGVKVVINGNDYYLEANKTFGDIEGASSDLSAMKEVPEGRVSFKKFVYINDDGEEVELKEDTVITTDIVVVSKFTIAINIVYKTDDENYEDVVRFELEEGKTIGDLDSADIDSLNAKLREIEKQFENTEKENYKFSKFVREDGSEVDIEKTTFEEKATLEAIFEERKEPTPIEPNPGSDTPNTGINLKEKNNNYTFIFPIILVIIIVCTLIFGYKKYLRDNR